MQFWQSAVFLPTEILGAVAAEAEKNGFAGLAFGEHLVTPREFHSPYPYSPDGKIWWDPAVHWPDAWVSAGWLGASTTSLRFLTTISILPLHDPFSLAKAVATAAYLTGDRVAVGAGAGWLREEFEAVGISFTERGRRFDEMLVVLEKLLSGTMVSHDGDFWHFPEVQLSPAPRRKVPLLTGGHSPPALRRASGADGWVGGGPYTVEEAERHVRALQAERARQGSASVSDGSYEILIGLVTPPSADDYRRLEDLGVTGILVVPALQYGIDGSDLSALRDAIDRFGESYVRAHG